MDLKADWDEKYFRFFSRARSVRHVDFEEDSPTFSWSCARDSAGAVLIGPVTIEQELRYRRASTIPSFDIPPHNSARTSR